MRFHHLFALLVAVVTLPTSTYSANGGWNNSPNTQYHIQTDEGPERYFRYQTISGQYRKEKRLEDGTVIGSYGWVDANGYLRLRDYIADDQGYRILKTKNIFVGKERPIQEAVSAAKNTRPSAGVLVSQDPTVTPDYRQSSFVPITPKYSNIATATPVPSTYLTAAPVPNIYIPATKTESAVAGYTTTEAPFEAFTDKYSTGRVNTPVPYEPYVQISPNSIGSTETPLRATQSPVPPSASFLPPSYPTGAPPTDYQPSSTPNFESRRYTTTPVPIPAIASNSLDYSQEPTYKTPTSNYEQNYKNPYIYQNGPTYPIDRNGNTYNGQSTNQIGNGYDPQYPYYDGVAVTSDGFRYYLPRQYHEEQTLPGDQRSGSFGYIDPFGIRRVIYYNTAPGTGFQHRKNNRYVGFQATPYDPRPYRK